MNTRYLGGIKLCVCSRDMTTKLTLFYARLSVHLREVNKGKTN